jgi:hypothetical protein
MPEGFGCPRRSVDVLKGGLASSVCWLGEFRQGPLVRLGRPGRDDVSGSGASSEEREGVVLSVGCTTTDFCLTRKFAVMVLGGLSWIEVGMRETRSAGMARRLIGFLIVTQGRRSQGRAST